MRTIPIPAVVLSLAAALAAACAAPPGANAMPAAPTASSTPAGQHRFIVRFREGSAAARSPEAAQRKLDAMAPVPGVELQWQRRLGVGADLFFSSRPLDAAQAEALMQRFRADPDVEYVEPDGRMTVDPIRGPDVDPGG